MMTGTASTQEKAFVSGYVITYNEAKQIKECIERMLPFCDEVVVADMGSLDGTAEIARGLGARVIPIKRYLTTEPVRDEVVSHLKHKWVFYLDADERASSGLGERVRKIMDENPAPGIYLIPVRQFVFGKRIRHCGITNYKGFFLEQRLFHRDMMMSGRGDKLHGSVISKAMPKNIWNSDEKLDDLSFDHLWSPNINHYINKMARYTNLECEMNLKNGYHPKWHKIITSPAKDFFYRYVLNKGFLDGAIGLEFCTMAATYQFYRILKTRHPDHVGDVE